MSHLQEPSSQKYSGYAHSFDSGVAMIVGLHAAILYNHIVYWININMRKKGEEKREGKFWMYETQKEMAEFFGYMSEDDIYRAIKNLIENQYIIKGNFNKNGFNRTSWYALYDESVLGFQKNLTIPQNCGMESAPIRNPNRAAAECIYTIENQKKNDSDSDGAPPAEKNSSLSSSFYTTLKGEKIPIDADLISAIWQQALRWEVTTAAVQEAIDRLKTQKAPITDPIRYVETTAKNIMKDEEREGRKKKDHVGRVKKPIPSTPPVESSANKPKITMEEFERKKMEEDPNYIPISFKIKKDL